MRDAECQEIIHGHIVSALHEVNTVEPGDVITGWVVCYEVMDAAGDMSAARVYGPAGMTTWRAHGLCDYLGAHDGLDDGSIAVDLDEQDDDE